MRTVALFLLALLLPAFTAAAPLVNINTADAALLDTLPGIGPAIAQRVIDYRTAHGPFAVISDIQNVSGIGPSTYAALAPLVTVGDTAGPSAPISASTTATSGTTAMSGGGASTYVPPPSTLSLTLSASSVALLNVPASFTARATTKGGDTDMGANISWSFGDGSFGTGTMVEKTYRYAGTYLVTAIATDGSARARGEIIITAHPASVRIAAVSSDGITIANDSIERLDLSEWRLLSGLGFFRIPTGTLILPQSSVLFPASVTNLPFSLEPQLAYPDGRPAARYAPASAQLSAASESSHIVQTVEVSREGTSPAESTSISSAAHDTTSGRAPAAETELAAAGAAIPEEGGAPAVPSGLFSSPWTYGLFGILAIAGGAFILL